jgi:CheY-like chemotaxis protein
MLLEQSRGDTFAVNVRGALSRETEALRKALLEAQSETGREMRPPQPSLQKSPRKDAVDQTLPPAPVLPGKTSVLSLLQSCMTTIPQRLAELTRDDRRQFLASAADECERLSVMVLELVNVERLEKGQIRLRGEEVDFSELIREVVPRYAILAEHRGVAFRADCPDDLPHIQGDRDVLAHFIRNLLSNALGRCSSGDLMTLSVRAAAGEILLVVSDDGPGIPRSRWDDILNPPDAASPWSSDEEPQPGMGLYPARLSVEKHGGRIWIESEAGCGTDICATLPVAAPDWTDGEEPRSTSLQGSVVVCDTDPALAAMMAQALRQAGHKVEVAYSRLGLIRQLSRNSPDVLVSDLVLADMSTEQMFAVISEARQAGLKFVLHTLEVTLSESCPDGVDVVLRRPAEVGELLQTVQIAMIMKHRTGSLTIVVPHPGAEPEKLREALLARGHICITARDTEVAARMLTDWPVDFVVLGSCTASMGSVTARPLQPYLSDETLAILLCGSGERTSQHELAQEHVLRIPYQEGEEEAVAEAIHHTWLERSHSVVFPG